MIDLLQPLSDYVFMQKALASGILAALATGIVGTWMILRGLSFIGDALAHGVLPGVASAMILGYPGMIGAGIGGLVMIGGISLIQRRTRLTADTAIGLLFAGMLALGVIIVSRSNSFSGDLVGILFGDLLGATNLNLITQAITLAVLLGLALLFHRPFLLLCFSPEYAQVSGYNPRFFHTLMLVLIGGVVIASFQTVGTMLVFGLLVAPAATAALWVHRMGLIMALAGLIGSVSVFVGLLISYHFKFAAGASIIITAISIFFASLIITSLLKPKSQVKHG